MTTHNVICADCQQRLMVLQRLGLDASVLWQLGNRDGLWQGHAAFHSSVGRTVLCAAKPVEQIWRDLLSLQPARKS